LTRHIQALEEKLGVRLLERNTHAVNLTPAGRLYLQDAQGIVALMDRASVAVSRAKEGQISRLRLAFVGVLLDEALMRLLQNFRQVRPNCQLEISDLAPADQQRLLESGDLDGGFIGASPLRLRKNLCAIHCWRETFLLALPRDHPLVRKEKLVWDDLHDRSWVLVSSQAAPAFRRQFSEINRKHKLGARVVHESERLPAILTMVGSGAGLSLVPQAAARLIKEGVIFKRLPAPQPELQHAFVYDSKNPIETLKSFVALVVKSSQAR
jgi:DNA-binding transcriptional LysR family regulator